MVTMAEAIAEPTAPAGYSSAGISAENDFQTDWDTVFPRLRFGNHFRLYHASMKPENGSALELELKPAHNRREGYFFLTLAPQLGEIAANAQGRRTARFDWSNKLTAKLGLPDILAMLLLLRGESETLNPNGRGLFHQTAKATMVVGLEPHREQQGVYWVFLSRKLKDGEQKQVRRAFLLSRAEALALRIILEHTLVPVIYGFPAHVPAASFQNRNQGVEEIADPSVPF